MNLFFNSRNVINIRTLVLMSIDMLRDSTVRVIKVKNAFGHKYSVWFPKKIHTIKRSISSKTYITILIFISHVNYLEIVHEISEKNTFAKVQNITWESNSKKTKLSFRQVKEALVDILPNPTVADMNVSRAHKKVKTWR